MHLLRVRDRLHRQVALDNRRLALAVIVPALVNDQLCDVCVGTHVLLHSADRVGWSSSQINDEQLSMRWPSVKQIERTQSSETRNGKRRLARLVDELLTAEGEGPWSTSRFSCILVVLFFLEKEPRDIPTFTKRDLVWFNFGFPHILSSAVYWSLPSAGRRNHLENASHRKRHREDWTEISDTATYWLQPSDDFQ